jgi:GTP cyclohydrolase I
MTTIMEELGLTPERIKELMEEIVKNAKNDKNGSAINTFMEVAEGKQIGEILYLGSLMRDYIMYSTGK